MSERRNMFPKGTKRKFTDTGDEMVDECMIQEEMTQDGSWQVMAEAFHGSQAPADHLEATKLLCQQSTPEQEECMSYQDIGYNGVEIVINPSSSNASSAYISASMEHSWEKQDLRGICEEELCGKDSVIGSAEENETPETDPAITEQVLGTFEIKDQAPCPDPVLDELFSNVDSSYYDLDSMLTGVQGTPKTGPYELLESLSSHGGSSLGASSSCRPDLNELDHIMEIIVGS
ncbi:cell division cycle-associated protein 4 isoform X1 [Arapaima gigas]